MTVICVCNGIMAADGASFVGDNIVGTNERKIVISPEGLLFGFKLKCIACSGNSGDINLLSNLMAREELDVTTRFNKANLSALAITEGGIIIGMTSSIDDDKQLDVWHIQPDKFYATGAGMEKAMSYLQSEKEILGENNDKSAIKAVEFAIKHNAWCGGKIMAYDFVNGREIDV